MARVHLICGRICSGKTWYAHRLKEKEKAVVLSTDEITLALPQDAIRDCFDDVSRGVNDYLLNKSLEIIAAGVSVILDWGFWTRKNREDARRFYSGKGIETVFHYIETDGETLTKNIAARNLAVERGQVTAFLVDEGLAGKCENLFEVPAPEEIDCWVDNRRP